jgi:AraC-like DNA-binding protein
VEIAPQTESFQPNGHAVQFHPDFLRNTSLGQHMNRYTFFSYDLYEALHLSVNERQIILDCLAKIEAELIHAIDKHSRTLVVSYIELLLNYSVRFYDRQFITRSDVNQDILIRFERILNEYFSTSQARHFGLPTVRYCADKLHISANYFADLIKKETGKSPQEHIRLKLIDVAKEKIFNTGKSVSEITFELGFKHPQHFSRLFKQIVGSTQGEYRLMN